MGGGGEMRKESFTRAHKIPPKKKKEKKSTVDRLLNI